MFGEAEGYVLEDPVQPPPGRSNWVLRSDRTLGPVRPPLGGNPTSATVSSRIVEDEVGDWRTPLVKYLQDPKSISDRKV
jgi:hypothetical protein